MKKGACVAANSASAPLQPRIQTNEVTTMLAQDTPAANDDPDYPPWADEQHAIDAIAFDEWLETPAGKAWLAAEEFEFLSQQDGYGHNTRVIQ